MTKHFERQHPGEKICYSIRTRKTKQSFSSPSFLYEPRQIARYPSPRPRHSDSQKPERKELSAKNTKSTTGTDKARQNMTKGNSPLSPLRSPSVSISLHGSPPLVNLYGLDLEEPVSFEPPRKVVRSCSPSTLPVLALPVPHAGVGAVKDDTPLASSAIPVLKEGVPVASVPLGNAALPAVPVPPVGSANAVLPSTAMSPTTSFMASLGLEFPPISPSMETPSAPQPSSMSVVTCPPSPDYVMRSCQGSDLRKSSCDLAQDPRLFFVGAPSGLEGGFIGNMLQRANKEARRSGGPSVKWIPASACCVTKVEELHFPDGRNYRLRSTICPDPSFNFTVESATQTEESDVRPSPVTQRDASTQVAARQTFILE